MNDGKKIGDAEAPDQQSKLERLGWLRREIAGIEADLNLAPRTRKQADTKTIDQEMCGLIVENSHDLISVHDMNGDYIWVSPNCVEFFGHSRENLLGTNAYLYFHKDDLARVAADHESTIKDQSSRVTYRILNADGTYRWVETRSYTQDAHSANARIVAITRDVHDQYMAREQESRAEAEMRKRLQSLAKTDPLTQLPNRLASEETLQGEIARSYRTGGNLSVAMIDVDHFKLLNDTHGHPAGDRVLAWLGNSLKTSLRTYDHVGRWGGEEFLVLLPETALESAYAVIDRARTQVADETHDRIGTVTFSAGVTQLRPNETLEELISRADQGLYRAKNAGRNRVSII